ncbi:hypothetical protein ACHMW6_00300 (plasmid) [Pseudoduganella sp. UC29_106]|uniref:hypothetical protein n=1 Tax=Pseudoduganella sp. UC29_106 TaxID=3374553 RepID=UPI0037567684
MRPFDHFKHMNNRQQGFGTIDLVVGVALSLMLLILVVEVSKGIRTKNLAFKQAEKLLVGSEAMQSYLNGEASSITASGQVAEATLKSKGYLGQFVSSTLPMGGQLVYFVRKNTAGDLIGLACGNSNVTVSGVPSYAVAAAVVDAMQGSGLRTSQADPNQLNGRGFQTMQSPVPGAAIVCSWAYLPKQT